MILFLLTANNIYGFQINIEVEDSTGISEKCKIDRLDIKSEKNKDYKHWEISPMIASRSGIEFNIMYDSYKTKFSTYEKLDSTNFKHRRTCYGNSVSGISIKYLPGKDDIPSYDKVDNGINLTYLGKKTKQSFAIGFKSRSLHSKNENAGFDGFGMGFGYGFVINDGVHHYISGTDNFGKKDIDVHLYFEFEPAWENRYFILGVNYNTYFQQFSGKVGYKF
ncbi:MAG: hypothetical protein PHX78_06300 [bacterium]|nr:hypothetical protein [bacterium]